MRQYLLKSGAGCFPHFYFTLPCHNTRYLDTHQAIEASSDSDSITYWQVQSVHSMVTFLATYFDSVQQ